MIPLQAFCYITIPFLYNHDLVIFPECALTGYPLEDLVLRESFMVAVSAQIEYINEIILTKKKGPAIIYGAPRKDKNGVRNMAFLVDPQASPKDNQYKQIQTVTKTELPNYGVFDEKRVFVSGEQPFPVKWRGHSLGLMICEDCWFPRVSREMMDHGAQFLISINGSPFEVGKNIVRRDVIKKRVQETGLPFLYVNMVGAQDELVFDGGSFFYDGEEQYFPTFEEGIFYLQTKISNDLRWLNDKGELIRNSNDNGDNVWWSEKPSPLIDINNFKNIETTGLKDIYRACVLGTRDYVRKQGFKSVVLGYSGGVDSGLVAAIAVDAIGPENVHLVRLPSKYSSQHSLDDAAAGAERLGAEMRTISIEPVVQSLRDAYQTNGNILTGIADENVQARVRGNILMAISNQEKHLLLTTGNKSEVSVGYCTIYGDMSGGFNPIKDLYKTTVWELCRWRNKLERQEIMDYEFLGNNKEVVPEEIIAKPPSAELRPDQFDEQSLPAYPILDAILKGMIEEEKSVSEISDVLNVPYDIVMKIRNLVDRSEYKRRQSAPGIKITGKIHGRDRRYPIINSWRG